MASMDLLASILYFAGLSVMLCTCGLLFLCRRYFKYFPTHILLLFVVDGLSLLFDLMTHAPITPMKNLWLMLLTMTHMTLPVFGFFSISRFTPAPIPLWLVGLCMSGLIFCLFRIPLIELHNSWTVENFYPKALESFYYPAMTAATLCYLILSVSLLGLTRSVLTSDFKKTDGDQPKQAIAKLIWWSLTVGTVINLARIMQCFLMGDPSLASLGLTSLDVFVSCGFWIIIFGLLLKFSMQDIPVSEQGLLTQTAEKYYKHSVDDAQSERIKAKLTAALKDPALITDNLLTLSKLSKTLGERHHCVSQVINRDLNSNFFDVINRERIRLACELITEQPDKPIVEIYVAVGFNSKATFYKAFSKFCGMTPARFKEKLIQMTE
jgi:AraC-like DNA-binding protein